MFIDEFHTVVDGKVRITASEASRFAKNIAGDFNPIHDPDAKRFCVPGDLLFALVLARYGLSERMSFSFRGMVGDDLPLHFPDSPTDTLDVTDTDGKVYLHVERSGDTTSDADVIEAFIRRYIAFSGRNFPHFLHPLLAANNVMFNTDRPMVIYDSMGFHLRRLDADTPRMELADSRLEISGKRADAMLDFRISADGETIGTGEKKLVVSGLREYDEERMQRFIEDFTRRAEGGATR